MPELLEISGLEGDPVRSDLASVGIAIAVMGGSIFVLGVLVPMIFSKKKDETLGDLGIIKRCRVEDRDPGRPKKDQAWCLWDSKGRRILGRHPSRERALRQERLIQMRKHG